MSKTTKMSKTTQQILSQIDKHQLTNNTQKVALRLISANGDWIPKSKFKRIPSPTSRIRDLRTDKFGSFKIECKNAEELGRKVSRKVFYYRMDPSNITESQLHTLFG